MNSNKIFWSLINFGLIVLIVGMVFGLTALSRYGSSLTPARVIYVSAEGEVVAVPDVAEIYFSVVSEDDNATIIQKTNTDKVNKAIEFVKGEGVDAKDIKTSQYSLYPKYDYDRFTGQSNIYAYELRQSVTVKIRDFDKISAIVSGLTSLGVNEIGQLQFEIDDPEVYLQQAREEAFMKAQEKAETMARQNDVRVGRVVTFSESTGYTQPMYFKAMGMGGATAEDMGMPAPSIEPGSQEVKVTVNVTYEIK